MHIKNLELVFCAMLCAVCLYAQSAGAQCDVTVHEAEQVYTGKGMTIRMAWDRRGDVPAVLWLDQDTNEVAYVKNTGEGPGSWGAQVAVDKGSSYVPVEFDVRAFRMVALAFDSAGEPHLVLTHGPDDASPEDTVTAELMYVHRLEDAGWTGPEKIGEMQMEYAHDESLIDMDFDGSGRLHVLYTGYGAGYTITHLYREDGAWSSPVEVAGGASAMDAAVGPDGRVHIVYAQRVAGYYQALYKSSNADGSWPEDPPEQATTEPPIDCPAGPVSCWPAVTTDREGWAYVAYGVDPDPCCNPGLEDPCDLEDAHDVVINDGHVSYTDRTSGSWSTATEVISGAKLHGPYPEMLIDPVGVKYAVALNRVAKVAFDALEGSFGAAQEWYGGDHDWYSYDAIATGAGGWVAFTSDRVAGDVYVVHFERTGACGGNPMCVPDRTRVCGYCGTQTCGADSQWGECEGEGECLPEKTGPCGEIGIRTCGFDCSWGTCSDGCIPDETQECGNCGVRSCLADATWGPCEDEGECTPGATRTCDETGRQECMEPTCSWGDCIPLDDDFPDASDTADVSTDMTTDPPADPGDGEEGGPAATSGGCGCGIAA
ncbi:MAG: hypothetical protein ABIJ56_13020 [Pseudomonadota bacterium]